MAERVEHQAADALATILAALDEGYPGWPTTPVVYQDHVHNVIMFTVQGVEFQAVITSR